MIVTSLAQLGSGIDPLIRERIIAFAEQDADRLIAYLKNAGFKVSQPANGESAEPAEPFTGPVWTAPLLLELAAALQLAGWEASGLRAEISLDLPSAEEAFETLTSSRAHGSLDDAPITRKLVHLRLKHFSRLVTSKESSDVVVRPGNDIENVLSFLAAYLYENRHLMAEA